MTTKQYTGVLEVLGCASCGMDFGVERQWLNRRRDDGATFYCPAGHHNVYRTSTLDRVRKEKEDVERALIRARARADQALADAEHQRNRVKGYQGALGKAKKRAAAGVCPAAGCKRHFANVAAHVARMHPDLATDPVEEVVVR